MVFTKMEGIGNDYIYVDCTKEEPSNPVELAIKLSDRHFGIGSDGLILIKKSDRADFFMDMYNADGSRGKMCGNGIRCVGKYVYDNGLTSDTEVAIDTLSGVKHLKLHLGDDGKVATVSVDMGAPILKALDVPVDITQFLSTNLTNEDTVIAQKLSVNDKLYDVTCVSMGNPHAIVYLDDSEDISKLEIEKIGPLFENHPAFPERINTEFIQVVDRDNLKMRVWERGSGETLACGTGACASLVASVLNGYCNERATLHLIGGDLNIFWDRENNTVMLDGPATTVFTGEIDV